MFKFFDKVKKSKAGYTLTELIVVVAILGILAAIAVPMFMGQIGKSRQAADNANAKIIQDTVTRLAVDGTVSLPLDATEVTTIVNRIKDDMEGIPPCQVDGNHFLINLADGKVAATKNAQVTGTSIALPTTTPVIPSPATTT